MNKNIDAGRRRPQANVWTVIAEHLEGRIGSGRYAIATRLPTERALADEFAVNRATVRKALDRLEAKALIWRHVGRGTFVGQPPRKNGYSLMDTHVEATPRAIFEARLNIEPIIAGHAAHSATSQDIAQMMKFVERIELAKDWDAFERWDSAVHRAIAVGTQNPVFVAFLDIINRLREDEPWRQTPLPPLDSDVQRPNTAMHRRIVEAIERRDMRGAMNQMRGHLEMVRDLYIDVPLLDLAQTPSDSRQTQ